jgi:SPP1 family predicted phage head-tail adaptor
MLPRRISTGTNYTPIGGMTSKIDLLKPTNRRDINADQVAPDVFASNIWAKIQTLTSLYKEKTDLTTSEATHKIVIHYMDGVTSGMLVRNGGRIFNIEGTPNDPDGRRVELWINCYERNDGVTGVQQ